MRNNRVTKLEYYVNKKTIYINLYDFLIYLFLNRLLVAFKRKKNQKQYVPVTIFYNETHFF